MNQFFGNVENGAYGMDTDEKVKFLKHCTMLKPGRYYMTIEKEKSIRSAQQIKYIFSEIYPEIAQYTGDSIHDTHRDLKEMFFWEPIEKVGKDGQTEIIKRVKSLSKAASRSTIEVSAYIEEVMHWAKNWCGIIYPEPKKKRRYLMTCKSGGLIKKSEESEKSG